MKITFNVEISKKEKDGFKENHLNFNGDVDISIEELKELFNTYKKAEVDVEPEPVVNAEPVNTNDSEKKFTVAECLSAMGDGKTIYAVKDNYSGGSSLITESVVFENRMIISPITDSNFNTFMERAVKIYSTNELEFLHGKKVKEV